MTMKNRFDHGSQPDDQGYDRDDKNECREQVAQNCGEDYAQAHAFPVSSKDRSDVSHRLQMVSSGL